MTNALSVNVKVLTSLFGRKFICLSGKTGEMTPEQAVSLARLLDAAAASATAAETAGR